MQMKNRGKINLVFDFIMLLTILALFIIKGQFHETLAYTLGAMVILHIALHWKQIKALFLQLVPQKKYRYITGFLAVAAVASILTMPLYIQTNDRGHGGEFGQHRFQQNGEFNPGGNQSDD
jgi:hypothetical protein